MLFSHRIRRLAMFIIEYPANTLIGIPVQTKGRAWNTCGKMRLPATKIPIPETK